ncbi:uncharacterized protein EV420DRAFT_1279046 [Desarmillaria tabescens]|uniref:Uncharacterized protein n=1 Tax=Armillaria tabescens TaxID=1929756 RepID=A0AA39MN35_ARMTA|nr:uncharacterized protein EV420DRAFT_1279046 [Desarmillaria tabescens]KAK0440881.1 hypothetical protein EV420DRAFT_1279046 [Desarmillaria tabescens]
MIRVVVGPPVSRNKTPLSDIAANTLVQHYNSGPSPKVHHPLNPAVRHSKPLNKKAQFFEYAILDGRRIVPTSRTKRKNAGSSIVKVVWNDETYTGVITHIFRHDQLSVMDEILWAEILWMAKLDMCAVNGNPWSDFPELEVEFWRHDYYHQPGTLGVPPSVIPFKVIWCPAACGELKLYRPPMWVTTTLPRVRSQHMSLMSVANMIYSILLF